MKHNWIITLIALLGIVSCQQEQPYPEAFMAQGCEHIRVNATTGDFHTRTVLQENGSIFWSPNDSINVFFGKFSLGKFVSLSAEPEQYTVFISEKTFAFGTITPSENVHFWSVYPYNTQNSSDGNSVSLTVPSVQTAVAESFDPKAFPSVACSSDLNLAYYNICGGLKFCVSQEGIRAITFSSNSGSALAGSIQVTMDEDGHPVTTVLSGSSAVTLYAPNEGAFIPGTWYCFSLLPGKLTEGFTLAFTKDNIELKKATTTSVEVKRSVFGVLQNPDNSAAPEINLSASGTANSYIAPLSSWCTINGTVKGKSSQTIGSPVKVSVLWESFNSNSAPNVGDVIKDVTFTDGVISFRTTDNAGNALIAALDQNDVILWSWHIWCTDYNPEVEYDIYSGHSSIPVMNRNLGALSNTPGSPATLGLYYQWGRKDPFPSSSSIQTYSRMATCPADVFSSVSSSSSVGTIDYATHHPTQIIRETQSSHDWMYSSNSSLWGNTKTIYDPCPPGWKVPESSMYSGFTSTSNYTRDTNNRGVRFNSPVSTPSTFYPAAGTMPAGNLGIQEFGESCHYWTSSTLSSTTSKRFCVYSSSAPSTSYTSFRSHGFPVRCCKETSN